MGGRELGRLHLGGPFRRDVLSFRGLEPVVAPSRRAVKLRKVGSASVVLGSPTLFQEKRMVKVEGGPGTSPGWVPWGGTGKHKVGLFGNIQSELTLLSVPGRDELA